MKRCVNIDWLEVYCLEPSGRDEHDDEFFRRDGWNVITRPYGTRVYEQMFTLYQDNTTEPLIEIRRVPVGAKTGRSIIDPDSCHIRLSNRTCYFQAAAKLLFDFIIRYEYTFMRISRIDICLDFEHFDKGDKPAKFVERFMKHRYAKINQGAIRAVGKDLWDGQLWNSLSWGSPKSMITTKLYNKSLELAERKDKPYIRQAWAMAGLVDDFISLTRKEADGNVYRPDIWRVEFSIKSSVKRWFIIEDYSHGKKQIRSVHNTLDEYFTRQQLLDKFAALAVHYFHFKKYQEGQRKDRCEDKVLFDFSSEVSTFYDVEKVASSQAVSKADDILERKLQEYRIMQTQQPILNACDMILRDLHERKLRKNAVHPYDESELSLLRQLISIRIKDSSSPLSDDISSIRSLLSLESELFGERDN